MKHHKYWNTMWTERDEEFYWDGLKTGTVFGAIVASAVSVIVIDIIDGIKQRKTKERES